MGIEVGGLLGLIILILDIWAILKVIQSGASTGAKLLWDCVDPGPAGNWFPAVVFRRAEIGGRRPSWRTRVLRSR